MKIACFALVFSHLLLVNLGSTTTCLASDEIGKRVLAAGLEAQQQLKSGEGQGTFKIFEKNDDWDLVEHCDFKVWFVGQKYHLKLDYPKLDQNKVGDRYIAICDGSAIFVNRFSDRMRPVGCCADIYDMGLGMLAHATHGFHWDLTCLERQFFAAEMFEKFKIRFSELSSGLIEGRYGLSEDIDAVIHVNPAKGWHIVMDTLEHKQRLRRFRARKIQWTQQDGIWFIKRLEEERIYKDKARGPNRRLVLEYDTLKVNSDVPDKLFKLDALEPRERMKIIDRRKNAVQRVYDFETFLPKHNRSEL